MSNTNEVNPPLKSSGDTDDQENQHRETQKLLGSNSNSNNANNAIDYHTLQEINSSVASIQIHKETSTFDLYKGLFYMFISCVFKSLFSILSKLSLQNKKDLSSFQLLTFRTYFMLWINVLVILFYPIKVFSSDFINRSKIVPMIMRTIFAIISMSLVIFSLKQLHISDVYSVYYLYPGMVILFSLFYLKEKPKYFDIVCLCACFIGALLIVKPDFIFHNHATSKKVHNRMLMFGLVFLAAVLKAIEDVIVRDAGNDVHYLVIPFLYGVVGMILFPIPMLISDKHYPSFTFVEVIVVFLIAVCTFAYQAFMALGLQNENAGRVSLINYFQVAFMYLSDLTIFGRGFQLLDFIGTVTIFGFNIVNGAIKCRERFKQMEKIRDAEIVIK